MYSLRLFDIFILGTELMQLLIRKIEDFFFFLRTEKIPFSLSFLLLLKLKEPVSSSLVYYPEL